MGAVAAIGFIQGLSKFMGSGIDKMLNGAFGWLLLALIVVSVFLKILFDLRLGDSLIKSVLSTFLIGVFTYGVMYGLFWYLDVNIVQSGKPLLDLVPPQTPAPRP